MVKIYQQPFAHAGTKQVIPDSSDPQGFVSNADGFTTDYELPDTDPNYKPIERAEFNGLMNMVTESLGEIQQFGFAKWQPITWPQGARVVEGGVVYRALVQTSQQPPHADWIVDQPDNFSVNDEWHDSNGNFYRVYSDGWIEQGGYKAVSSSKQLVTINFNKAFTTSSYVIQAIVKTTEDTSGSGGLPTSSDMWTTVKSRSTSNAVIAILEYSSDNKVEGVIWCACGY